MLISPSYSVINMAQTIFRICRCGLASKATVRVFYCNNENSFEESLMRKIQEKGKIVESIVADIVQDSVFSPANLDKFIEPENESNVVY